ncbi:formyltetrahydrofolate deformylase [Propioniciclava tarda]|uniref:Formyltetrahydrofolate deformylase n=1 Tax=Propioniciclava tarda TaxID=433330 RepID=A0A4Q9KP27_PROTD|nr:formyltetrahydrofolate deformylase [Propioniciclava tarda]TBT95760.1 formyltetrahydrofolate deformylase [Propioniciclava tarda]HOA88009.1 formyltetrahydrofolate deformylase [Propioniciclava tarda]HQA29943.1 formyltetrahydrofolate deformylase [Propioniciclava tarda]HQD60556.1 formyltetrahydrofolate deformylase [Propioniciclava tarda]
MDSGHWVLSFACDDRQGIVHSVTGAIAQAQGNITELQQFTSDESGRFFMRVQVQSGFDRSVFEHAVAPVVSELAADWALDYVGRRRRTLILASRAGHCLNDLLYRQRIGDLPITVAKIMANHPDLGDLASFYGVPFESHVVLPETKADFEQQVLNAVAEHDIELVVLARYMQILSPRLCEALAGRAINIHHSFLPGFKGANPYRQAHARGVKLIGATAHFVTGDLDEGPIIEQNVQRVDHADTVADMTAMGHELESRTLATAVRLYAEHRVLLDGARTVVFS